MIPENITKEHIIGAINRIKAEGIPPNRQSTQYFLEFEGEKYPPKYVISIAYKIVTGTELSSDKFKGGENETNSFLKNRGFTVVKQELNIADRLIELIRKKYPGWNSFRDEGFVNDEILYKRKTVELARGLLSKNSLKELIDKEEYDEIVKRVEKVGKSNNLLFFAVPKTSDLAVLYQENFNKKAFCHHFYDLLYGEDSVSARLDKFAEYIKDGKCPKWTFPTFFLFFIYPETEVFIKPEAIKWLIDFTDSNIKYDNNVSGKLYEEVKGIFHNIKDQLKEYNPVDMIDVQSLIWVCKSEYIETNYWVYAPGEKASFWDEFYEKGIIAIGWDDTGDLSSCKTKEDIISEIPEKYKKSNTIPDFVLKMKPGDKVLARNGSKLIIGAGEVEGDYYYDSIQHEKRHRRKIKWYKKGEIDVSNQVKKLPRTTLLKASKSNKINEEMWKEWEKRLGKAKYWWLSGEKKHFIDLSKGDLVNISSETEKGNKANLYENYRKLKPGDIILGYTYPIKKLTSICEATKPIHSTEEGECFEYRITEQLQKPVDYEQIISNPYLSKFKTLRAKSLIDVTPEEYNIINELIHITPPPPVKSPYTKEIALKELFINKDELDEIQDRLKYKKNLILSGPPGVGKTYIAKRLAYLHMGFKDDDRIEMVQFHQSYSYEDFIQGFRPTEEGKFQLTDGVFYRFCKKAQKDKEKDYFFIIDEINRGNLSKIFGELMMLIEADKRGEDFAIPLTYSGNDGDRFHIPENLYLIGTMNTADRSLAMVDYALRRRFAFVSLNSKVESDKFREHITAKGIGGNLIHFIMENVRDLNNDIAKDDKNLGAGFCIGHSYFCPCDLFVDEDGESVEKCKAWYERIIKGEIMPLLEEYWFDKPEKIKEWKARLLKIEL